MSPNKPDTAELRRLYDALPAGTWEYNFEQKLVQILTSDTANIACCSAPFETEGSFRHWPNIAPFIVAAHNEMPALLEWIAELEASELKTISERDEWSDLFDKICGYLGIETEYSNIRSADDVLVECGEKIGELLTLNGKLEAYRAAMRQAVVNAGGVSAPNSDNFYIENVPAEMAALRARVKELENALAHIGAMCWPTADGTYDLIHKRATEALK